MCKSGAHKTRIAYLDLLRIISGFLVVTTHVAAQRIEELPVRGGEYAIANAFDCLGFSGVALFVMISGALALNPDREAGIRVLLWHKTLRFLALYYIWKALYQVEFLIEMGKGFTFANVRKEILYVLVLERGYYHLWFLPMIAIMYMAVPIIRKGVADKKVCRYFCVCFFAVSILFPTLFLYEFKWKPALVYFFTSNDFGLFSGYIGYFVLGHYLHCWGTEISTGKKKWLYAAGVAAFIAACILGTLASRRAGEPSYMMNTPFAMPLFFTSTAIYIAAQSAGEKIGHSERAKKALHFGADRVLGIYLLHPLVINLLASAGLDTALCSPALSIPLMTGSVFLMSGLLSWCLSKIPVIKKLL